MQYREWVVTAARDTEDGRVYLTAHAEGKPQLTAMAIQGPCGKYVTTHWREGRGAAVYYPELRIRTMSWLEREYL